MDDDTYMMYQTTLH